MAHSLTSFAAHIAGMVGTLEHSIKDAAKEAGEIVEKEAKRVIGTYDYGWAPLAESTLERKSADTPLLETGEMRDSIEHTVRIKWLGLRYVTYVGSNNQKAVWHELGTPTIPARPFLRGAVDEKIEDIVEATGRRVHSKLLVR